MANLEGINRASKKGFVTYMMANPFYFQQQFDLPATQANILAGYKEAMRLRKTVPHFPRRLDENENTFALHL
jgi:hypothetical protein